MSLYYKSFKNIQKNIILKEKLSFLDEEQNIVDFKDFYSSCPEKNELEDSFSTDEAGSSIHNIIKKNNNAPFSQTRSIKKILNFNECKFKEYTLFKMSYLLLKII